MKILANTIFVFLGLLFLLFVFAVPLALIHSLNQLFPALNIPYETRTWIAMFVLWMFFGYRPWNTNTKENPISKKMDSDSSA
jgi:hypothetical protein